MNYRNFLSSIPLREDILNDITYLQKQLGIIIKFYQKCSTKLLFVSPADSNGIQGTTIRSTNFAAVRKFMDELERELDDISNEQKMLTDILKNCLKIHLKTIKQKSNIEVDSEDANGYIANSIQAHYEKYYVTIQPHNVKTRIPEELLKKKYDELRSQSASEKPFLQLPPPTTSVNKKPIIPQHQQQSKSKQESLLKPKFRKPSAVPTLVKNPLAKVHKKTVNKVISVSGIKQVCDTKGKYKTIQNPIKVNNQAITHSRLNLLRALRNVKTEVTDNKEELNKFYTEKCRAIKLECKMSNISKQELNSRLYEIQKRDENNTDIYSDKADAKDIKKKIQENPTPPISDNTNNLPELNLKNFNAEMDFVESLVPESEMTIFPQLDDVALAPDVAYHEVAITEMPLKTDEDYFEEYKLKRFSIILTKLDPEKLKKIIKSNKKKRLMKKSFKIAKSGSGRKKITDNDGVKKNEMKNIKKTPPSTIKLNQIEKPRKSQTVPSSPGSIKKVHVAQNKLISLHGMMKKKGTLLKKAQSTGSIQKIVPFQRPASPAQNIYSDDDLPTDLEVIVDYIDYTIREESAAASLQKFDTYTIPEDDCGLTEEVSASSAIYRISSPKETV